MSILSGLGPISFPELAQTVGAAVTGTASGSFADAIGSAINQVEADGQAAKAAAMDLLANGKGDVHTVALQSQRAELSTELFQQVRNKFVQAYQEVMKMPM